MFRSATEARALLAAIAVTAAQGAQAADPGRGAQLYMRTDGNTRSCVSCHGPDPGLNHNNILRAADSPDTLTKVLNTVSAMGFLRPQLTEADKADITAFLGTVTRLNAPGSPLQAWPVTLDFGNLPPGTASQPQTARLRNPSETAPLGLTSLSTVAPGATLTHDCPSSLAPGGTCELRLQWTAQGEGSLRTAVEIRAAGLATPVYLGAAAQRLTGPASVLEWSGAASPVALASDNGGEVRRTLSLHNPGPLPAVLALTSITGPDAARFRVESGCAQGQVLQAQTRCDMVVAYTPSLRPQARAVLQVRSDQANPPSLQLEGTTPQSGAVTDPVATAASSGGGCSAGPPDRRLVDPTLLALLAAAALAWGRRRFQG